MKVSPQYLQRGKSWQRYQPKTNFMSLHYQRSKYWSVGCIPEQGFTFKSVVSVNTLSIKLLHLSGFDSTFFSNFLVMLLLSGFRR